MFRPVARFKHQNRSNSSDLEHLAPDPSVQLTERCQIIKVYDIEAITQDGLPAEIAAQVIAAPGLLWAKVSVRSTIKYFPFAEPEDYIYLVYGNAVMIEGREALVKFTQVNSALGEIVLKRSSSQRMLSDSGMAESFDIGGLI